jgi:hypothetical protein
MEAIEDENDCQMADAEADLSKPEVFEFGAGQQATKAAAKPSTLDQPSAWPKPDAADAGLRAMRNAMGEVTRAGRHKLLTASPSKR